MHQTAILFALQHLTIEGEVTAVALTLLSLISWTVIIGKLFALRRQEKRADRFYERFAKLDDPFELIGKDKEFEGAPPFSIYDYACREMQRLLDQFAPREKTNGSGRRAPARVLPRVRAAMERGLGDEIARLDSGMVILALSVSGGPFIGLFGTVFGVMETFAGVGQAGEANFAVVAPGVAGALLNTVLGLLVAIPALFAFNMLQRRIGNLQTDMSSFASELEGLFVIDHVEDGANNVLLEPDNRSMPSSNMAVSH